MSNSQHQGKENSPHGHQLSKNERIAESGRRTRERRSLLSPDIVILKVLSNKLHDDERQSLHNIFLQGKWYYNHIISYLNNGGCIGDFDDKIKSVTVRMGKDSDDYEDREVASLSATIKQGIRDEVKNSLSSLHALKENGHKTGKLKFCKEKNSVPLRQYGIDFSIKGKKVRIPKVGYVRVRGLDQLSQDADIANAKLVHKADGFYIHITVFVEKINDLSWEYRQDVGIDFGIKDNFTLSDGTKISHIFGVSDEIKKLQRKLSRQKKGSSNYKRTLRKIRKKNLDVIRLKEECANKIIRFLLDNYRIIYMQDENISGWHKGFFGKQVQVSVLGRVKAKLINNPRVVVLKRFTPTTQYCPACSTLNKHKLGVSVYTCPCGYTCDRDVHAARNMIIMGKEEKFAKKNVAVECGKVLTS